MTAGHLLFYSGAGLLALTIVLAIVFVLKKPQYRPESEAYATPGGMQKFRNVYPTDPITIRRDKPEKDADAPAEAKTEQETEKLTDASEKVSWTDTMVLGHEQKEPGEHTAKLLEEGTASLPPETAPLLDETAPLAEETVPLMETEMLSGQGAVQSRER